MALVNTGDPLTTKFVQPGGVYQTDGYGLLTGKATYIVDRTVGGKCTRSTPICSCTSSRFPGEP